MRRRPVTGLRGVLGVTQGLLSISRGRLEVLFRLFLLGLGRVSYRSRLRADISGRQFVIWNRNSEASKR